MGRLIPHTELSSTELNPTWYFADARYDGRDYHYKWPSPDFPASVAIHYDISTLARHLKSQIRLYVEQMIADTVIFEIVDKSYYVSYSKVPGLYTANTRIDNRWFVFHFSNSESAVAFSLRFNDIVEPVTDLHPKNHSGTFVKEA